MQIIALMAKHHPNATFYTILKIKWLFESQGLLKQMFVLVLVSFFVHHLVRIRYCLKIFLEHAGLLRIIMLRRKKISFQFICTFMKGGPGASGRVLPPVTGRSRV